MEIDQSVWHHNEHSLWHHNGNDDSRDAHCEITLGNDVARDILCEVTMSNGVAMCTYHGITMHTDVAMNIFYYVFSALWNKNKKMFMFDQSPLENTFVVFV